MPTQTAPSQPHRPWTEIAPHGSSILRTRSLKRTPPHTRAPASTPIITDDVGDTNAQGAVIATSPANIPLQAIVISGLPKRKYQMSIAIAEPATAARFVFTATTEIRRSVAPSVEPGLKPIQPNSSRNVPVTTYTMLCAGKTRILPPGPYLPRRGPRMIASAMAQNPPTACTTVEPAKSTYPWPMFMVVPSCESQPPPHVQQPDIGYKIAPMNI